MTFTCCDFCARKPAGFGQGWDATWTQIYLRKRVRTKQRSHMHWHKYMRCEVILQMCSFKSRQDHNNKAIHRATVFCCLTMTSWYNYTQSSTSSPPPTDILLCAGGGRAHNTSPMTSAVPQYLVCCWLLQHLQFGQDSQVILTIKNP